MANRKAQLEALSMFPHELLRVEDFSSYDASETRRPVGVQDANVFSSLLTGDLIGGMHTVAIDLDLPVTVVPSSTAGHCHLYIDKPMEWPVYVELLNAFVKAGLVESGYRDASIERGATHLRLPWIKKETA